MLRLAVACLLVVSSAVAGAAPPDPAAIDALHDRFAAGSIDSVDRADAAVAATAGAKTTVEKDYKDTARGCLKTVLVNQCIDRARDVRRRRLADIAAVELEADRFKRRDRSDRLESDRKQRDAERSAKAPIDDAQRARSREAYDKRQTQAAHDAVDRDAAAARRSAAGPRKPPARKKPTEAEASADVREKNARAYEAKQREAVEHQAVIEHRLATKAADKQRRDAAKAAKEAKEAKPAPAAAPSIAPPAALPAISGTKP